MISATKFSHSAVARESKGLFCFEFPLSFLDQAGSGSISIILLKILWIFYKSY